jgi:hypothetical protein
MRRSTLHAGIFFTMMLASFLPAQGHAQSRRIKLQPAQVYTNDASQFQFPPTVGDFQRESTFTQFDREGRDIGVGYNDLVQGVAATVYVYPLAQRPPNDTLESHFSTCKAEVLSKHADAKRLSEGKIHVSPGGHKQDGLRATFTFTDVFAHQRQSVRSELYLFTHRRSFVLFRVTYPAGQQAAAEPSVEAFIDGLAWP